MQLSKKLGINALLISGLSLSIAGDSYALNYKTAIPVATLLGSIFYLYTKKPDAKFKPRYKLSLLANPRAGLKNYAANLWYILDDGIIGQTGKSKTPKVTEDGTIECSTQEVDPAGVLGKTDAYIKPLEKSFKTAAALYGAYYLFVNPDIIKELVDKLTRDAKKAGYESDALKKAQANQAK